jgi:TonB family protein
MIARAAKIFGFAVIGTIAMATVGYVLGTLIGIVMTWHNNNILTGVPLGSYLFWANFMGLMTAMFIMAAGNHLRLSLRITAEHQHSHRSFKRMTRMDALKKFFTLCVMICSLLGIACRNPLARFSKQYNCQVTGEGEPTTAQEYLERGKNHIGDGDPDCAFGACSEALRLDPRIAQAYACRGYVYVQRKEYEAALADYTEAIRLDPNQDYFYYSRSKVYRQKGLTDLALADLDTALKLTPKDSVFASQLYKERGDVYFDKGDYESAVSDYTEAIRLKPDYSFFYEERAKAYRKAGKPDLAEADEQKAKELEPAEKGVDQDSAGRVLNEKAISLPKPAYPPAAKAAKASGTVVVRVIVDEKGNVVSAEAISGHPLLRAAAVQAARQAKFKPTLENGRPVKVTGTLNYNFVAP